MPGTRKLNRPTDQRKAMLRNLVTSFLENGRIETTLTRAKETQSMAEKMITLGKTNTLHSRRPKYADRNGGYTRIYQTGPRRGDSAPMAILELVD